MKQLKISLLAGAAYFFFVSLAHMFGVKVPWLYIYFDLPGYVYQDKIISILAFGWGCFLLSGVAGVKKGVLEPVRYILIAGGVGIAGLCFINLSVDFSKFSGNIDTGQYWIETGVLLAYFIWIKILYSNLRRRV